MLVIISYYDTSVSCDDSGRVGSCPKCRKHITIDSAGTVSIAGTQT